MSPILFTSDTYQLVILLWIVGGLITLFLLIRLRRSIPKTSPQRKRIHAGLSMWFVLATLTAPELYCALFYDCTDSFSVTNASQRWYRMHVQTNEAGFRDDRPFHRTLSDDSRQIVFVGDSFTFGHGLKQVEDRFSDRIAAQLEQSRPGEFSVVNAGIPGLDSRRLVIELLPEWFHEGYPIDMLVYTFVMNDIEHLDDQTGQFYQNQQQVQPQFVLFRDSYFYNLLYYRLQYRLQAPVFNYYGHLQQSFESVPWDRLESLFDMMRRLCRERSIELRVVVFPFLHDRSGDYAFASAHRKVVEYFQSHDVPCIDLESTLAPHYDEDLVVSSWDAHPNERAHALAADAIRTQLLGDVFDGSWPADASQSDQERDE